MIAKYGGFEFALAERYRFENELGRGAMGTVYLAVKVTCVDSTHRPTTIEKKNRVPTPTSLSTPMVP